ncbi:DUF5610 domain-containing protein [Colwellia sp. 1_MG-2023]|uniref:DUF5610 domain-containing protein n=1 Tax=unclassified Colwellia TaxID=196834 RepID=UPI0020909E73|nr:MULTISPECIES: DUF5610 domain-containing protein [unclassified Colwellia]MDO6651768.1 DUF5610 domain-containing protein [Colwellia sp. 3_MG-2023]MDO6665321.1 DUF5610 domain-containing protein [Colwellia sp. 2_MG-2023]MDO6689694.1 DUF5610 domain-containing protein [Colwellia sp. 1_MG-2023]
MSSPINSMNTVMAKNPYSQDTSSMTKSTDSNNSVEDPQVTTGQTGEVQESIAVSQKKQLNAAIIESTLEFSNSLGDQPLSLALKAALQGINEALQVSGVESSVEDAYESGLDFSPEATAERIVSFSTQFLGAFREQNPDLSEEESLNAFMDVIGSGIDQGFGEAKDILGGLNVLEGEVSDTIDTTYDLVQEGLQAFVDSLNEKEEESATE